MAIISLFRLINHTVQEVYLVGTGEHHYEGLLIGACRCATFIVLQKLTMCAKMLLKWPQALRPTQEKEHIITQEPC